ncbi:glycoside hydrolase family 16 protein [Umezawaea endophytica]|uniref:Glycoside hydrolase family 16 protein n=1 Tax=Umezawaea endophytica TaxID=1654476 RepID=A0A9X2VIS3_9PSEU|nr:glycoside hydrolase family 16 protein [Umezawaea endophytica]MCS7477154.1 glycoside hydrolase family 16 protein [Umezawaea endophytica]
MTLYRRRLLAGAGALSAAAALVVAGVAIAQPPTGAGTNVSTCNNPVLNKTLAEWGSLRGTSPVREAVGDHRAARFAYAQKNNSVLNPSFYLPQQHVVSGEVWTFAYDVAAEQSGRARVEVDWYSTPEGDNSGYLGNVPGTWVSFAVGGWTRVASEFTVPAGAVRANVVSDHEYAATGASFRATACDYHVGSGTTTTTTTTTTTPPNDQTQAAVRLGWGAPLPSSDEFGNTGPVDPAKWSVPSGTEGGTAGCWPGHNGNGRRCAKNAAVANGIMKMTGEANGDTGWLKHRLDRQYGRWEIRSRSQNTGTSGGRYHVLHLLWPTSERWPQDGEYDWVEYTDPDAQCLSAFLHYPHPSNVSVQQEYRERCPVDMRQWHNFAFEWTPSALVGYVDGVEWFRVSGGGGPNGRQNIQTMPSGHLNIQLDNFTGDSGLRAAVFEVDWVRVYS